MPRLSASQRFRFALALFAWSIAAIALSEDRAVWPSDSWTDSPSPIYLTQAELPLDLPVAPILEESRDEYLVPAIEASRPKQNTFDVALSEELPSAEVMPAPNCDFKEVDVIVKPTYKLRGRIFFDGIAYDEDQAAAEFFDDDRENSFGFDTARIGITGDVYEQVLYILEFEFEGTETDFKDVYMEAYDLPVIGRFRAGHFKEPISLEELTSSNYITFMERSPATTTFAPSRSYGAMIYNHLNPSENATWFLGGFRHDSDDSPTATASEEDDRNDWAISSRFATLPYYDEPSKGRYMVHLGGSYSYRNSLEPAEFDARAWLGNQEPIGVGALATNDDWNQIGGEFAVVWGAASVQAEYYQAFVTSGEQYNGAYVEFSYFLTGEHRGYRKDLKTFDRVYPHEPAFWVDTCGGCARGRGAWELTGGYSYVNLRDGADAEVGVEERAFVDGFIVGVNWYLNPYSRVMFNYNHEITDFVDADTPDGDANIFGARWQVDF